MTQRLELRGLSKHFVGVQALADVSFSVAPGEVVALVGENGAGKSTLIRILSGAHSPDRGAIAFDGKPVDIGGPADAERLGIATVYQELSLFPDLSVAENLLFGRFPGGPVLNWRAARREAAAFLADLGMDIDVTARVRQLGIADKQMLEIAKALYRDAKVVILDEPTAVLGGADVEHLVRLVRDLAARGVSVLFVSHRLDEVFDLADSYVVLKDGRLTGTGRIADTDHDDLVAKMVGRDFERAPRAIATAAGETVLQVEGLTRAGVLHQVSFSVRAGEILGLAGLRGAGRTEVARAIFGADPVDAGTVTVRGRRLAAGGPPRAIRAGLGLVPEERKSEGLFTALSTTVNIPLARTFKHRRFLSRPAAERRTAAEYVRRLRVKVANLAAPVGTLSGGNQQKVVLAKWLHAEADVLLLDEPTRGIDVGAKQEIYALVQELCAQGRAIVLISSELPEILALSHRILVMCQGRVAAELDAAEATEETIMSHAVGGA